MAICLWKVILAVYRFANMLMCALPRDRRTAIRASITSRQQARPRRGNRRGVLGSYILNWVRRHHRLIFHEIVRGKDSYGAKNMCCDHTVQAFLVLENGNDSSDLGSIA